MARWPNPTYNRIIETDPQIVKVPGASSEVVGGMGWGARTSLFGFLGGDPKSQNPSKPSAPEISISHVSSKG